MWACSILCSFVPSFNIYWFIMLVLLFISQGWTRLKGTVCAWTACSSLNSGLTTDFSLGYLMNAYAIYAHAYKISYFLDLATIFEGAISLNSCRRREVPLSVHAPCLNFKLYLVAMTYRCYVAIGIQLYYHVLISFDKHVSRLTTMWSPVSRFFVL